MSIRRLCGRAPSAVKIGTATLHRHQLKFHKFSQKDGSAKCDAEETDNPMHFVFGVVFDISESEKPDLDQKEGLGKGYEEKNVHVELHGGPIIKAYTYYATQIDVSLKPFHWYKQHVLKGAIENKLSATYIQSIRSIESIADPDTQRHVKEVAICRD